MDITDQELISQYLNGQTDALDTVVNRYLKIVYTFIYRLVNDQDTASELSQITFIKVWQKLNYFDQTKNFKTWLLTIAKNTALDHLRKKKVLIFSQLADNDLESSQTLIDQAPLPSDLFEQAELGRELELYLNQLATEDKIIILLHHENDLSLTAIADLLGKPPNTVKSRYRRALAKVRTLLLANRAPK